MKRILTLTLAALLLLTACAAPSEDAATPSTPPVTTSATTTAATTTTADRDTLTKPDLTDIEREIIEAMWAKYKKNAAPYYSINTINLDSFFFQCGDAYALFVIDFKAPEEMLTKETIGEYEFRYTDTLSLSVYHDGEFTSLAGAHASGILSDDELKTVWEAYKAKYPGIYDSDEW
jgi:hypothetical protein